MEKRLPAAMARLLLCGMQRMESNCSLYPTTQPSSHRSHSVQMESTSPVETSTANSRFGIWQAANNCSHGKAPQQVLISFRLHILQMVNISSLVFRMGQGSFGMLPQEKNC